MRNRPALVISAAPIQGDELLLWVLMITSASNGGWIDDVSLEARFAECGLNVPCVVRTAKISTVAVGSARMLGVLPTDILAIVSTKVAILTRRNSVR